MLRPYQQDCVDAIWDNLHRNVVASLPTGCHCEGQKVLLFNGKTKAVENLHRNNVLMGDDSTPRYIKKLIQGEGVCYTIHVYMGPSFTVNEDHIFSLKSKVTEQIISIPVKDYLLKNKEFKDEYKLYYHFPTFKDNSEELYFEPYFMGLYLMNGKKRDRSFVTYSNEPKVIEYIYDLAKRKNLNIRTDSVTNRKGLEYALTTSWPPFKLRKRNQLKKESRKLGLSRLRSEENFIPHAYKCTSRENQLKLLAGIIDGLSYHFKDHIGLVIRAPQLARDVVFLCHSLGFAATMKPCNRNGKLEHNGKFYKVTIYGDYDLIPTLVEREVKAVASAHNKLSVLVRYFSIKHIGIQKYYGFTLSGNNLYLLNSFVVTHNSGKSFVIAGLCKRAIKAAPDVKICVLAHVKELLEQNREKLHILYPAAKSSIYCAGLKSKQVNQITFASIQSIYKKSKEVGAFDIILVDEAHRIPHGDDGIYQHFFKEQRKINPKVKVPGLTATPYRTTQGMLHKGDDALFEDLVFEQSTSSLIRQGFLCNISSKQGSEVADLKAVATRCGDFVTKEMSKVFNTDSITDAAVNDVLSKAKDRHSIMVFCCSIDHVKEVCQAFIDKGINAKYITGKTPSDLRASIIDEFKTQQIRVLVSCNIFTTGFDVSVIDCIVFLIGTKSPGKYVQIVGRGLRTDESKKDCLLLDYGGNIERHGPLDQVTSDTASKQQKVAPTKVCPNCSEIMFSGKTMCPSCKYEFTRKEMEISHETEASTLNPFKKIIKTYELDSVTYNKHEKLDKPPSMRVTYWCKDGFFKKPIYEWVCFEHSGFSREKAKNWAARRGIFPCPASVDDALELKFFDPKRITVDLSSKFPEILDYRW